MEKRNKISVIIVNWNGGEVFRQCLQSLLKVDYRNWELILVDNGSIDGSDDCPRMFPQIQRRLKVIKNKENLGFAQANNQGFKKAKGEFILLLNNDTKVPRDFFQCLVQEIKDRPEVALIQPKIYLMDKPKYLDNCGSFLTRIGFLEHWGFFEKDGKKYNQERLIFSAKGACMFVRRKVIEKVGLFDADFGSYFEETDFCWRVWLAGWKILYWPGTHIYHKLAYTAKRMNPFSVNYHSFKNRINSLIKNLGLLNLVVFLPVHFVILESLTAYYLIRFRLKEAAIIQKAIIWNLVHLPQTLRKRKRVQSQIRKLSDNQVFSFILWPVNVQKHLAALKRLQKDLNKNA